MTVLLQGARVFDALEGAFRVADVLVSEDRIAAVGSDIPSDDPAVRRIDLTGKTVLPGLINMHDHPQLRYTWGPALAQWRDLPDALLAIRSVRAAMISLSEGVTTVRSCGAKHDLDLRIRDAVRGGLVPGPRILAAGTPISITGGHAWFAWENERDGVDAMRQAVRTRLKHGSDWIKLVTTHEPVAESFGGQHTRAEFSLEELQAATAAAGDWGKPVAAHANGAIGIERAIQAGVDTIEHGIWLDAALAERMADRGIGLVPTLTGYVETASERSGREPAIRAATATLLEPHRRGFEAALEAGVRMGIGTDTAGFFVDELELFVEYGATPVQALQAATINAASMLGMEDLLGSVTPGKQADLVVVDGDPGADVAAVRNVHLVVQAGRTIEPRDVRMSLAHEDAQWNSVGLAGGLGAGVPGA